MLQGLFREFQGGAGFIWRYRRADGGTEGPRGEHSGQHVLMEDPKESGWHRTSHVAGSDCPMIAQNTKVLVSDPTNGHRNASSARTHLCGLGVARQGEAAASLEDEATWQIRCSLWIPFRGFRIRPLQTL